MTNHTPATPAFNTAANARRDEVARLGQALLEELSKAHAPQANTARLHDLLAQGASVHEVNSSGQTALMVAIHYSHTDIAAKILDAGASVHARDNQDNTPLIWCGYMGNTEIALRLLRAGASLDASNSIGRSVLTQAANKGYDEFLGAVIGWGCDPDHIDRRGETPLTTAAAAGRKSTCLALIGAGANPIKRARSGKTPAEAARDARYTTIADAIEKSIVDNRERILLDDIRQITEGVREDITVSSAPIKAVRKRAVK